MPPLPPKLSAQYQKEQRGGGGEYQRERGGGNEYRGATERSQGGDLGSARGGALTDRDGALPPIPTGGAEEAPSQVAMFSLSAILVSFCYFGTGEFVSNHPLVGFERMSRSC